MSNIRFLKNDGTFSMEAPETTSGLYFPIASETGLKSSLSPQLGGDAKLDQESFLLEPVSVENLHNNRSTRNFWCVTDRGTWSATGASAQAELDRFTDRRDASSVEGALSRQTLRRESKPMELKAEITSFVPAQLNAEVMRVDVTNTAETAQTITTFAAVPIYGRSADNIRDHRNVTSMLHRIRTTECGVVVKPTMSFDERGHRENHRSYYVCGVTGQGVKPEAFYPTVEMFLGEGGTFTNPKTIVNFASGEETGVAAGTSVDGKEAMGAMRFATLTLQPMETAEFIVFMGICDDESDIDNVFEQINTEDKVRTLQKQTEDYWQEQVNIHYHTGSAAFDNYMRWVSFQPFLRRIYGCSFLPHHDYGRGGRGWRDLWQDCLSLILMDPKDVRKMLIANFGGVRPDGTNATIIGEKLGEFKADRNGIPRVWMDHGLWPLMTVLEYVHHTGDLDVLNEKAGYFDDASNWQGTLIEHLLLENLTAFYRVGEHGMLRLLGADWNDALDMASERGESVAFSCAYAGNLEDLANLLEDMKKAGQTDIRLRRQMLMLLEGEGAPAEDVKAKETRLRLFVESVEDAASHRDSFLKKISVAAAQGEGFTVTEDAANVSIDLLIADLRHKAAELKDKIRGQEWITEDGEKGWFNSYYDNDGQPLEHAGEDATMMLTGQVFAVMSGTATEDQVKKITKAADAHLYEKEVGGYRLNTNFHQMRMNMGRMFGFAYGEKENGAVFSHMTVMYANALYKRGFVREGYKALQTLMEAAMNFDKSRIYPGIPEYFNNEGRGLYNYLTGAASWYMMTMVEQVYGIRCHLGTMAFSPALVKEQFDEAGDAWISFVFQGETYKVTYSNPKFLDAGQYQVGDIAAEVNRETGVHEIRIQLIAK